MITAREYTETVTRHEPVIVCDHCEKAEQVGRLWFSGEPAIASMADGWVTLVRRQGEVLHYRHFCSDHCLADAVCP